MKKNNTYNKPYVNIGTIGQLDYGKMTLTEAINKALAQKNSLNFESQVLNSVFVKEDGIPLCDENNFSKVKVK